MPQKLTSTIIEGIGDDLVYGFMGFIIGAVPLLGSLFYWQYQRSLRQAIHPDSLENVQNARQERQDRPTHTRYTSRARDQQLTCPICLGDAEFAIETNCAHIFCAQCIITYWRTGNWMGAIRCPNCRQTVTVLLRNFSEQERASNSEERSQVERDVNLYNRRFSGEPVAWLDYIRDLPTILRHLMSEFFSVEGLVWMFRLRVIVLFLLALLYFISPLDIIPEAAFGLLGFLDDLFILLLLSIYVTIMYRRFIAARAGNPSFQ